jgi:hypothetical protein
MDRDILAPFGGPRNPYPDGSGILTGDGEQQMIDRLIGNAYQVVKYVACHLPDIIRVANFIKAEETTPASVPSTSLVNEVPFGSTVVFDVSTAFIQELTLTGDVTSSSIIGELTGYSIIIIRIIQDAVGGHAFVWPPTIHTHGDISLDPNAISQQMFAKNPDGSYDYVNPMMYPGA